MKAARYDHTQHAPMYMILVGIGGAPLVAAWLIPIPPARIVLAAAGGSVLLLAASFRRPTVRDETDRLTIEFGPLPLFRRSAPDSWWSGDLPPDRGASRAGAP